jgi:hypothetical protein
LRYGFAVVPAILTVMLCNSPPRPNLLPVPPEDADETVPAKLPGLFIGFLVPSALGLLIVFGVLPFTVDETRALIDLAALPRGGGSPDGEIFRGTLQGPQRTTPLGHAATAWLARLEHRGGKVTSTRCQLGEVEGLALERGSDRLALPSLKPSDIRTSTNHVPPVVSPAPIYRLGPEIEVKGVPEAAKERCLLDPEDLKRWNLYYIEQFAPPDALTEVAGCKTGQAIAACPRGAGGHLVVGGMPVLLRELGNNLLGMSAFIAGIALFFVVVSAVGATFSLYRAARLAPRSADPAGSAASQEGCR